MNLVVYAEASSETYPGHMVVGQEPSRGQDVNKTASEGQSCYFGYRFDPADLPESHRKPEKWRDYLFKHAVPGSIVDETAYVSYLIRVCRRTYHEKRAECIILIESQLPPRQKWAPHAWYSFSPDATNLEREPCPHLDGQPCYNCVKWAILISNCIVEGFLTPVEDGRLKRVLTQLVKK
jgi:hypothetical protein